MQNTAILHNVPSEPEPLMSLLVIMDIDSSGFIYFQGRSQPHSPGWARVPLSSFFPQTMINYSYFPQTSLIFFLILVLRVGDSPTREGPGYATVYFDKEFVLGFAGKCLVYYDMTPLTVTPARTFYFVVTVKREEELVPFLILRGTLLLIRNTLLVAFL